MPWSSLGSRSQTGARHALAQTALMQEILLQSPKLPVKQVVGQLDQANHHVGGNGRVGVFDAFPEGRVIGVGLAVEFPRKNQNIIEFGLAFRKMCL